MLAFKKAAASCKGWMARFGVVMAALAVVLTLTATGPAEAQSSCGTIQSRVNNVAAGGTIDLPDNCVYRETVTITKPLTLRGGPGVQIRGSNVWTNWTRSGDYWVKGTVPHFETLNKIGDPQHPYPCEGTARCLWPEQVFFDGKPLTQVASNPASGQFAVNSARQVVLANDPNGHSVEVTVRRSWIVGQSGGVTVEGFTMKHAGNGATTSAMNNNGRSNWTVRNNDLSWAHGGNLALSQASGLSMIGNAVHHAGQLGVTSSNANLVAENNDIYSNNTERFYPGWSTGGIKVNGASRFSFSNNRVHDNDWYGVWVDNGSENVTISNNRVHHNTKKGIQFEISDYGKIYGNVVWENGRGTPGGGIHILASRNVEVYNNTLAWNRGGGICVLNEDRRHGDGTEYDQVRNVRVHHNAILMQTLPSTKNFALDWRKSFSSGNLYNPDAGNRGYDNSYWYAGTEASRLYRFYWNSTQLERLGAFNATLGEERGRYLSYEAKQQVALSKGIPPNPES